MSAADPVTPAPRPALEVAAASIAALEAENAALRLVVAGFLVEWEPREQDRRPLVEYHARPGDIGYYAAPADWPRLLARRVGVTGGAAERERWEAELARAYREEGD